MGRYKIPLDAYDMKPEGMIAYLRYNGWHFNKKMCDWAITLMRKTNATTGKLEKVEPTEKDTVEELLKVNNVKLENADNYDFVYVANMARADICNHLGIDMQGEEPCYLMGWLCQSIL